jgi:hypothetical protein
MSKWWNTIRGELVEIPGLLGFFMIEIGEVLEGWSIRHRWSRRDLEEMAAEQARLDGREKP